MASPSDLSHLARSVNFHIVNGRWHIALEPANVFGTVRAGLAFTRGWLMWSRYVRARIAGSRCQGWVREYPRQGCCWLDAGVLSYLVCKINQFGVVLKERDLLCGLRVGLDHVQVTVFVSVACEFGVAEDEHGPGLGDVLAAVLRGAGGVLGDESVSAVVGAGRKFLVEGVRVFGGVIGAGLQEDQVAGFVDDRPFEFDAGTGGVQG